MHALETTRASGHAIARSARKAVAYLRRHARSDGRFDYSYDAETGQVGAKYNLLRHAGCTMVLYRASGTSFDDGSLSRIADAAMSYLLSFLDVAHRRGRACACVVEGGVAKLGGGALTLLALVERVERAPSRAGADLEVATRLAEHLLSQQDATGRFVSKMIWTTGQPMAFESAYYPGEAVLALCGAHRMTGERRYLDGAELGARWLLRRQLCDRTSVDHWLAMALASLHAIAPAAEWSSGLDAVVDRLVRAGTGWMGARATTTQISTRLEALAAAWFVARRQDRRPDAAAIFRTILAGLDVCHGRQFGMGLRATNPDGCGGFVQGPTATRVRIDYVQHALAASLEVITTLRLHRSTGALSGA